MVNLSGRWNDLDLFELGIDGWRLCACMVGITLTQVATAVRVANSEADRGQR